MLKGEKKKKDKTKGAEKREGRKTALHMSVFI